MYIEGAGQMIDPNIVSGADFDNRNHIGYDDYMAYDDVSPELDDELMRLHEMIAEDKAEVIVFKAELKQKEEDFKNHKLIDNWSPLIYQRNNGTLPNTHELHLRIEEAKRVKDNSRMIYANLQGDISKLKSQIQSRENGSIFGLQQEFKAKAGFDYTPPPEVVEEVSPVIGGSKMDIEMIKRNAVNKGNNLIDQISNKIGISNQNTKYALIVIGVLGALYIIKK